jgi:hypothetical protein
VQRGDDEGNWEGDTRWNGIGGPKRQYQDFQDGRIRTPSLKGEPLICTELYVLRCDYRDACKRGMNEWRGRVLDFIVTDLQCELLVNA